MKKALAKKNMVTDHFGEDVEKDLQYTLMAMGPALS